MQNASFFNFKMRFLKSYHFSTFSGHISKIKWEKERIFHSHVSEESNFEIAWKAMVQLPRSLQKMFCFWNVRKLKNLAHYNQWFSSIPSTVIVGWENISLRSITFFQTVERTHNAVVQIRPFVLKNHTKSAMYHSYRKLKLQDMHDNYFLTWPRSWFQSFDIKRLISR